MADRIKLFAEHHIVAIRTARRNGEIIAVKHAAWGWMAPRDFYLMQEMHTFLVGALPKIIEGGYRFKESVWSWEIDLEIIASGVKLPAGLAIFAGALALYGADRAQGKDVDAFLDLIALVLPFGELWLLYRGVVDILAITSSIDATLNKIGETARHESLLPPIIPPVPLNP